MYAQNPLASYHRNVLIVLDLSTARELVRHHDSDRSRLPNRIPDGVSSSNLHRSNLFSIFIISCQINYTERLLLDYRYMDAHAIAPRFEYGFGLSYTTFTYSGLTIKASGTSQVISFTVKNTGAVTGTEIPQLYLGYPPSAGEPPKVLRGFDEVPLTAGASQQVVMTVGQRDMRYVFFSPCVWEALD
jgi:hypothetical protein